jgi:hypothetical protein
MRKYVGVSVLLLATACWADDYSFARRGENVTVYGYGVSEADACAGSFDALDTHVAAVRDFLWVDGPQHYVYRWFSDAYWSDLSPCSSDAFACTSSGEALSRNLPDMHEAVHMVTYSIGSDGCPSVLDEGLARYLGAPNPREWDPSEGDIRSHLTAEQIAVDMETHALAGHFVSFLVERYGAGSIVMLCNALPQETTIVDWELAVGRYLGKTLDALIAEYESYPVCTTQEYRARLWECAGDPDFTFSGEHDEFVIESGCFDSRAMNSAWGYVGNTVITRRIYFPEDTWVAVEFYSMGDSGTAATFVSQMCAPCSAGPQTVTTTDPVSSVLYRAGMHEIVLFFDQRDTVQLYMGGLP